MAWAIGAANTNTVASHPRQHPYLSILRQRLDLDLEPLGLADGLVALLVLGLARVDRLLDVAADNVAVAALADDPVELPGREKQRHVPRVERDGRTVAAVVLRAELGLTERRGRELLRERLDVHHAGYVVFQMAEVAVPRELFAKILKRIGRLRFESG